MTQPRRGETSVGSSCLSGWEPVSERASVHLRGMSAARRGAGRERRGLFCISRDCVRAPAVGGGSLYRSQGSGSGVLAGGQLTYLVACRQSAAHLPAAPRMEPGSAVPAARCSIPPAQALQGFKFPALSRGCCITLLPEVMVFTKLNCSLQTCTGKGGAGVGMILTVPPVPDAPRLW